MKNKYKHDEEIEDQIDNEVEDDGIADMTGVTQPVKPDIDPLEKEEREAAKKNAKPAPSGAYVVNQNMKVDGKAYKKGDAYEGKLYQDLIDAKALIKKS